MYLSSFRFEAYEEDNWVQEGRLLFVAGTVPIPEAHQESKIYAAELIKVQEKVKVGYLTRCILIIQYIDSVWVCFMSNSQRRDGGFKLKKNKMLNENPIAQLKMIRDHNQTIYFAEEDQRKFSVIQIELDRQQNLKRKDIFHLSARKILALEIDFDNVDGTKHCDSSVNNWQKKSLFVLDSNFMLYHLEKQPESPVFSKKVFSMNHHELSQVQFRPFTSSYLSSKVITINNCNYSVSSNTHWYNIHPEGD